MSLSECRPLASRSVSVTSCSLTPTVIASVYRADNGGLIPCYSVRVSPEISSGGRFMLDTCFVCDGDLAILDRRQAWHVTVISKGNVQMTLLAGCVRHYWCWC